MDDKSQEFISSLFVGRMRVARFLNVGESNGMKASICIATFNGEKYIKEQLDSILVQLENNDEVIISDDGSTDNTISIIESYKDCRVKYYKANYHDYTKNFENAINKSKGDIILIADQDDVWNSNKLIYIKNYFRDHDCNVILTDATVVDENLSVICGSYYEMCDVKTGFILNWLKSRYVGACMGIRRDFLKILLPFPKNTKLIAYDYWIACFSEFNNTIDIINLPMMKYRRHSGCISPGVTNVSKTGNIKKIMKRLYILPILILRTIKYRV